MTLAEIKTGLADGTLKDPRGEVAAGIALYHSLKRDDYRDFTAYAAEKKLAVGLINEAITKDQTQ